MFFNKSYDEQFGKNYDWKRVRYTRYGNIIYSEKESAYFITNDAAFELGANRQVMASAHFIPRPNEIEEGEEKAE